MTKAELINEIAIATGYDKKTITVILEQFMSGVKKNVAKKEPVFLRGFGTFTTKTRAAKVARNIGQRTSVQVPEHKIPFFKPSADFSAEVR
ncbi:MAG: integration host factor subunit beta [Paludibacteraceae bacterium]|nr:integration host factor subunit beta [Paludibacteraceae bacterium]